MIVGSGARTLIETANFIECDILVHSEGIRIRKG